MCAGSTQLRYELRAEVANFRAQTFAINTKKCYESHLRSYLQFCETLKVTPVPATDDVLSMYAAFLARRLRPASIRQYLNVIRLLHLEANLPNPCLNNWILSTTLKGIDREKGCPVNRKAPISPEMLLTIKSKLALTTSREDAIFWAACLLMFYGLFRKSNLYPRGKFDGDKQFVKDDFSLTPEGALRVRVRWSKTNQFKKTIFKATLPKSYPHPLCPVHALCKVFSLTAGTQSSVAFPGTTGSFDKTLARCLGDQSNVSAHSFRRGGAVWHLQCGTPGEVIKLLGDWKSHAYLAYLDQIPDDTLKQYRQNASRLLPSVSHR